MSEYSGDPVGAGVALVERVTAIVRDALSDGGLTDVTVGPGDSMDTVPGWDSMRFMSVFLAVNDAFGIDPDFDDAIHYTAIPSLVEYLSAHVET
jgi:acyl carrier protein